MLLCADISSAFLLFPLFLMFRLFVFLLFGPVFCLVSAPPAAAEGSELSYAEVFRKAKGVYRVDFLSKSQTPADTERQVLRAKGTLRVPHRRGSAVLKTTVGADTFVVRARVRKVRNLRGRILRFPATGMVESSNASLNDLSGSFNLSARVSKRGEIFPFGNFYYYDAMGTTIYGQFKKPKG